MKLLTWAAGAALVIASSWGVAQDLTEIDKPASELEEVLAQEIELPPGAQSVRVVRVAMDPHTAAAWHTHPSPVYVYVVEGEVTLEVEGETKTIKAGEAVAEPLDARMRALNTTDQPAHAVVFQVSPKEKAFLEEEAQN
ncbi:cupin domain-containing protein [Halomonas stenophila]|uniref:Quercetin dioxygenase-like cupin family protein n=1 Tax=Halomonas stenophila TaxID=795312 RepID=A0A7W5HML3_9GAMM|nr:cupin domain-containing protein [Halomonas stenophila]MBB3232543.1 quercetin dioxygenase-like cupin family protein [Halomonas stenophila]